MKESGREEGLPQWKLERYLLGELPADELQKIQRQVEASPALKRQMAALEEENRAVLERYPAPWMAPQIQRRAQQEETADRAISSRLSWKHWLVPALAACCLVVFLPALFEQETDRRKGIMLKGMEPQLQIFRKTDGGQERLQEGTLARQGDVLQVVYQAAGQKFGAIFSIDGRGEVTWHLPESGVQAVQFHQGGVDTLAYAYELDDAPGWERFYFITAPTRFGLVQWAERARRAQVQAGGDAALDLAPGFEAFTFTLKKADHE